ncbi:MAG: hypothetical protein ACQETL_20060 [Bacteroidota bacterium]
MEKDHMLKNKMNTIVCRHCHEKITSPALVGLTLVCPYCKKSVNGQYYCKGIEEQELIEQLRLINRMKNNSKGDKNEN